MSGFVAFVDESGCDGFEFSNGSTEFLVIAAIVMRRSNLSQLEDAIGAARAEAQKPPGWAFKTFKKLKSSESQRWLLAKHFSSIRCRGVAVAIHKRGLQAASWQENQEDIYFHASKFLVERISWACRDTHSAQRESDPLCEILFSKQGKIRYENFQAYIAKLRESRQYNCRAEWLHIDESRIMAESHSDSDYRHLIADHFASAIGCALEAKMYGIFDDRYARIWAQKIYDYNGKKLGNGLKFWPESGIDYLNQDFRGEWLKLL